MVSRPGRQKTVFELLILLSLLLLFVGVGVGVGVFVSYLNRLPSLEPLQSYSGKKWEIPTRVYSLNNELVAEFFQERRDLVSLSEIPQGLIDATIAIEDHLFYRHRGISFKGIVRAFFANLRAGKIREGGSSITQQLVKLLFLTRERTYKRKFQEALLAVKIERRFSKEEILERYFNKIYFGHGSYGAEAASRWYFGKHARDLNLAECALLAGLIKAPNRYSPITNPEKARVRLGVVLGRMVDLGYISRGEAERARQDFEEMLKEGKIKGSPSINQAPYFVEHIRQEIEEKYGSNALYKGGLRVYTTLDLKMQRAAREALFSGLEQLNKGRSGESPKIEGALVAIDPKTGYIKAMVGGSGFTPDNQFNRTTQARRQPGSAFKPFLYAAAIDNGFTSADTLMDEPVVYQDWQGEWAPQNYDGKFRGLVTLRKALENSINVASVRLIEKVTPERVASYARRAGIKSRLYPTLSLALGTSEVTPIEMAVAYGVFANQGVRAEPLGIRYVKDLSGVLLEENIPFGEEVLAKETAYILTNLMEGVVKRGTASWAVGERLGRPVAGKTGTSNNFVDAWFVGFTPDLIAVVWIGYDRGQKSLGDRRVGGVVAAPIWRKFMEVALEDIPPSEFAVPENVSFVEICADTGTLPTPGCSKIIQELFIRETEPTRYCQEHQIIP